MRYILTAAMLLATLWSHSQETSSKLDGEYIFGDMRARHIGPAIMSGRVADIAGHPTDENVIMVGSAGGGVWKSTDAGVTFSPIFDEHPQSIGAVAFDPQSPDQVYWVGTGESWVRNSVSVGDGIYKSTDGGKSWKKKGLEKSERISSIQIDPASPNTIFVGALGALWGDNEQRGVYKSIDGGETWKNILSLGTGTGCADLAMDPNDPNTLYASMWEFRRTAYSFNSGGEKSALYKSTDAGENWVKIHNGLPTGKLGRIAVAIAPSQPETLYCVVECEQKEQKGLYRSVDGGKSWTQKNNDFELTIRPFYFSKLVIDPRNPEVVCKAGYNGSISQDGGNTFRSIGSGVHPDIHDFWFDIKDSKRMYLGCDGGVYRSWDGGYVWEMVKGLPLSQYYHLTLDDQQPYKIYGGLQDNGSWIGPSQKPGGIGSRDWIRVGVGDGFRVYPVPGNPDVVYSEMQGAESIWQIDTRHNQVRIVKPYANEADPKLRFNWNAPISTSLHNNDRFFVGSQFLHKSDDQGNSWSKISPDLTTNDKSKQNQSESGGLSTDNSGAENHCTIFTIAESPQDENIIWIGTDDGNVQVTFNGGQNWSNVTRNLQGVPKNTWVYHIEPSSHDARTAYAVFDGHTRNDGNTYVQKTTDGGKTWNSIVTAEINGFARCIQEDYENPNLLFLGTEFGLYITLDGGVSWSKFTNNMPSVAVHHLEMHKRESDLVMATHGRGIIILDDITPLRQMSEAIADETLHFFETDPTTIYENNTFGGYSQMGEFVGQNPSQDAEITYYLNKRHTFGKMTVEVFDEQGRKVADLNPGKSRGINKVQWNYTYPLPKIAKGKTLAFGGFSAPRMPPGKYTVIVTKGKEKYENEIELIPSPGSPHSVDDRKIQHESAMKLYQMNEDLAFLVHQMDGIETALFKLDEQKPSKAILQKKAKLSDDLHNLKETLVILTGDNYVGAAEPQLREKIVSLYSDVVGYNGRPTAAQLERLELLGGKLTSSFQNMKGVLIHIEGLNQTLEKAGLEKIQVPDRQSFFGNKA